jgi:energy-coupling factor transporter transmembrane protein EcfT
MKLYTIARWIPFTYFTVSIIVIFCKSFLGAMVFPGLILFILQLALYSLNVWARVEKFYWILFILSGFIYWPIKILESTQDIKFIRSDKIVYGDFCGKK